MKSAKGTTTTYSQYNQSALKKKNNKKKGKSNSQSRLQSRAIQAI